MNKKGTALRLLWNQDRIKFPAASPFDYYHGIYYSCAVWGSLKINRYHPWSVNIHTYKSTVLWLSQPSEGELGIWWTVTAEVYSAHLKSGQTITFVLKHALPLLLECNRDATNIKEYHEWGFGNISNIQCLPNKMIFGCPHSQLCASHLAYVITCINLHMIFWYTIYEKRDKGSQNRDIVSES